MRREEISKNLWDMLVNQAGSYQLKNEVVNRAMDAIEVCDISPLHGKITTFNPDWDPPLDVDEYSAETVATLMEKYGVTEFVKKQIREEMLSRLIDGKYGKHELEVTMKWRAEKAIAMSDMTPLKMGLNITYGDGSKECMSAEVLEAKNREVGLWKYVEDEINKLQAETNTEQ